MRIMLALLIGTIALPAAADGVCESTAQNSALARMQFVEGKPFVEPFMYERPELTQAASAENPVEVWSVFTYKTYFGDVIAAETYRVSIATVNCAVFSIEPVR